MLLRELNVGTGKRSRRKTGYFSVFWKSCSAESAKLGENAFGSGLSRRGQKRSRRHAALAFWGYSTMVPPSASCSLARQVVNQAVRIFHMASWEVWLVHDDLTTILYEPRLCFFHTFHRYLQNRPKRWAGLNE